MDLSLGFALFRTKRQVQVQIEEALAGRAITINVANYNDLISEYPAADYNGDFAYVQNPQGTAWLPGSLGGNYYPNGLYWSNGTSWLYTASPAQATQVEVNQGTNDDKFVTPLTFNNAVKWTTKENSANKSSLVLLGNSDVLFPTQNAVKVYVDNGLATKQGTITVSNTDPGTLYPVMVTAAGNLGNTVNINTTALKLQNGNLMLGGDITAVTGTFNSQVIAQQIVSFNNISSQSLDTLTINATTINSTNGGDGSNSALVLTGNNGYGGANYFGFLTVNNSGGTNSKKFFRINNTGAIEIVNNAYSANIFSLDDSGSLTIPNNFFSLTLNARYLTLANDLTVIGNTYLAGVSTTGTVTANHTTAFKAGANAISNVGLELPGESAIRNTGNTLDNSMYFDVNTGGANVGSFRFRGTSAYNEYAVINNNGIKALTPFLGKTSYNAGLGSEVAVDNIKYRITNSGGVFPQIASNTGGNVDVCYSGIGVVSGAAQTPAYANNSGILISSSWTSVYSAHGMDTRGDQFVLTVTDKNAGKIYRATYLVTNDSSNATGYNIIVERLI